jgi:Uncharacterised nucleotidyltransferase
MTLSSTAVPPPKSLQVALRRITETFARELSCPSERTPDWSDFDWIAARAVAAMHGVSSLLHRTTRWQGPAHWMQFLEVQRAHTTHRHTRINDLLQRIDQRSTNEGIAILALKGAALHAMGLYSIGDRPMADIDLLVQPGAVEASVRVLESLGYRQSKLNWKERVFNPIDAHVPDELGEHSNNDLKIELHERICERLPWRIVDATQHIFPAQPHPGLNVYPSKAALMIHLLLHAAGSMLTKTLRLLQLQDLALLSVEMTQSDWDLVLAASEARPPLWWAFPPLKLASRYYPIRIPDRVLAALAGQCPPVLRSIAARRNLYDVSYSYLWVDAFPGIEWSRSFPEAIEYAASRLRPDAKHLAAREHLANTESWAQQDEWSRLSHARRILRWLSSRPTRPVTMHAVMAAMARAA